MELVDLDFRLIIFSILTFIGGCAAFDPPKPVVIQIPKSVTTEKSNNAVGLLIELKNDDDVKLVYKTEPTGNDFVEAGDKIEASIHHPSVQDVNKFIGTINKQHSSPNSLNVRINTNNHSTTKSFKKVIEALKENKITRFQLITTPQNQNGH